MKITRLYLKNFAHIFSGLEKYEVELDFTKTDKKINIIIGKMGSCKTVILGHLQPFHSFGTLDVRNQDTAIIEGMDGLKVIEYVNGSDYYVITHNYIWNKNTHSVKSYIEKNGNELNPNGNQSSFKSIVEIEFGIEQNFLRLLRLGQNVSNVINMKSTERKNFIASLLKDAEIYQLLYKKLSDDMKTLNSQSSILSNKLHHIGIKKEDVLKEEYEDNKSEIDKISKKEETIKTKIYELQANINVILKDKDYDSYIKEYHSYIQNINAIKKEIDNLKEKIEKYKSYPSINEISKILGGLDQKNLNNTDNINKLSQYYKELENEISKIYDMKKMMTNEEQYDQLKNTYEDLLIVLEKYKSELKFFHCEHNASYITKTIGDLNTINILIEELSQYNIDLIKRIYKSDSSIINWSKKKIDILNGKKIKIQKNMNNIRFSAQYEPPSTMYLPPFCPTKECPYYKSHPFNIQKGNVKKEDSELDLLLAQIDSLDAEINVYQEYPVIYSKMNTLKQLWRHSVPVLKKLNAIKNDNLLIVLTNFQHRKWYDYDELVKCVELCEKRDKYYELTENVNKIKNELTSMELMKDETIEEKIGYLEKELDNTISEIAQLEESNKEIVKKIQEYNELYLELSQLSIMQEKINSLELEYAEISKLVNDMAINMDVLNENHELIKSLQLKEMEIHDKLTKLIQENESIKATLNDISYTKKEFEKVLEDREVLKYILDAVSSKEGIPLILVKMFINNCKDIINELVSDVFGDIIEILDFHITETEFKIPYSVNGVKVEDIEKASQGQQTIISIALSFALVRESMINYNIMLLDEVDGPLYAKDRNKFISILFKQMNAIHAEQVFLISHNNTFDGYPVNIIMTTDEQVDINSLNTVMRV